jgi:endonuclease YncB( thermonuclease family)
MTAAELWGPYRSVVEDVHDGDTVTVTMRFGFGLDLTLPCRIFGINAPELATDAGKAARDYARTLLPVGTKVVVTSHGWDKYGGRFDGSLQIVGGDGVDFASLMLKAGHAVPYRG